MSIQKEIEELQKKAGSYDMLYEEYEALKSSVKDAIVKLSALVGVKKVTRATSSLTKEIIHKEYELLKISDNYQVTRDSLVKKYPELSSSNCNNILTTLSKRNGVRKTKDGINIRLFYSKSVSNDSIKLDPVSYMG